eukprot:TRINITY_DN47422_c0_g1_i1.p1 TRINITY_DN47422_c0_g1~~TRINITY_DN47422_c0_g1_i1.p1  ORF type:complete len:303 (+),score=139.69 TRINITY_DN47422_c0_g1_i1:36-911(+)
MYNGVGLTTPRGSGTSGYIQRNAGQLAQGGGRDALMWNTRSYYKPDVIRQEKGKDIKEHELKREIELKLLIKREEMEDAGELTEEQIEDELIRLRRQFITEQQDREERLEAQPNKSLSDFREAFSVSDTYQEGQAFDRELQENLKQERLAKRQAKEEEEERARLEAEIAEEERKLEEKKKAKVLKKQMKKEEKKRKKEEKKRAKKEKEKAKKRMKEEKKAAMVQAEKLVEDVIKDEESKEEIVKEERTPTKRKRRDTSSSTDSRRRRDTSSSSSRSSSSSSESSRPRKRRR